MPSDSDYDSPITESRRRPTVVLAEDSDSTSALYMKMISTLLDCEIVRCRDGAEAFEAVRDNRGNVLFCLMDINMAGTDGIHATEQIRFWETSKRGTGEHVPICALTGSLSPTIEQECLAAGMDDFMQKPMQASDLRQLLHKYHLGVASL